MERFNHSHLPKEGKESPRDHRGESRQSREEQNKITNFTQHFFSEKSYSHQGQEEPSISAGEGSSAFHPWKQQRSQEVHRHREAHLDRRGKALQDHPSGSTQLDGKGRHLVESLRACVDDIERYLQVNELERLRSANRLVIPEREHMGQQPEEIMVSSEETPMASASDSLSTSSHHDFQKRGSKRKYEEVSSSRVQGEKVEHDFDLNVPAPETEPSSSSPKQRRIDPAERRREHLNNAFLVPESEPSSSSPKQRRIDPAERRQELLNDETLKDYANKCLEAAQRKMGLLEGKGPRLKFVLTQQQYEQVRDYFMILKNIDPSKKFMYQEARNMAYQRSEHAISKGKESYKRIERESEEKRNNKGKNDGWVQTS